MSHDSSRAHGHAGPPEVYGDAELLEIYDFALSLGRRAGKMLLEGVEKRCGEEEGRSQGQVDKMNAVDIVTQTDHGELFSFLSFLRCLGGSLPGTMIYMLLLAM